ncbi:MAG: hypothetical protein ABL888_10625 [Pirellulaceae bacterium]
MTNQSVNDTETTYKRELDPELQAIIDEMKKPSLKPLVFVPIIVALLWGVLGFLPWFSQNGFPWQLTWGLKDAGVFGDSFGFVNALFSGLAMAGVIVALWYQREELAEQRKELIITQWQLTKSADAQRDSQVELAKQAKINLQGIILTALDGISASSRSSELYGPKDADSRSKMIERLREGVILDILRGSDTSNLTDRIAQQLDQWRQLTVQIDLCRKILSRVMSTTVMEDDNFGMRQEKTRDSELNETDLRMLKTSIESAIQKLGDSNINSPVFGNNLRSFVTNLETARLDNNGRVLLDQIQSFRQRVKKFMDDSDYLRVGVFET